MVLGTGASFHPYFSSYGRSAAEGGMQGTVEVYGVSTPDHSGTPAYDPLNGGGVVPTSPNTRALIYRGPGRVIMNQDWRARQNEWNGQVVIDHAVSVMLNLTANTAPGYETTMPTIPVGSELHVVALPQVYGRDSDSSLLNYVYTVRIAAGSTTSWLRDLLCDIIPDNLAG